MYESGNYLSVDARRLLAFLGLAALILNILLLIFGLIATTKYNLGGIMSSHFIIVLLMGVILDIPGNIMGILYFLYYKARYRLVISGILGAALGAKSGAMILFLFSLKGNHSKNSMYYVTIIKMFLSYALSLIFTCAFLYYGRRVQHSFMLDQTRGSSGNTDSRPREAERPLLRGGGGGRLPREIEIFNQNIRHIEATRAQDSSDPPYHT